jgi:hypothetical protein
MSAHAAPARAPVPRGEGSRGRSLARGMLWVTWRQHRAALVWALALLGAFAVFMVVQGIGMHATYASLGVGHYRSLDSPRAASLALTFDNEYLGWGLYLPRVVMFLPLFIGAFVGAPLLAREFETGTFRFAWTQGIGRVRWTVSKLLLLGLVVTIAALAFSQLFGWWYAPFRHLMGPMPEIEGLVFAARVLFGFTAGVLVGRLLRRTVPAIAATMAAWFAVVLPVALFLRPHFLAPLVERVGPSKFSTEWTLSQWWIDPQGHRLSRTAFNTLARVHAPDPAAWLAAHHYVLWQSYQPASRFWTFQAIEASGLVALALVLAGVTVWLVSRRAA